MDKQNFIEKLHREIENSCDVKIEAQLSAALDAGMTSDDFFVACDNFFYREHSKDLKGVVTTEDAAKRNVLQLHLSRSGIYDQLPEGLFYQPDNNKTPPKDAVNMAEEYRIDKKKELAIRRFFMPFENDFFWQRVQLEKEESELLEGLHSGVLSNYFTSFWNIDPSLPKSLAIQMIFLLPYACRIAGNLRLTEQCLQKLLQEKISIKRIPASTTDAGEVFTLGDQSLGCNMLCGTSFFEPYPLLELSIGPLEHSKITDYLEGGIAEIFLKTFFAFFVPAEADVVTKIEVPLEKKSMHLSVENEEAVILGYSTFLL